MASKAVQVEPDSLIECHGVFRFTTNKHGEYKFWPEGETELRIVAGPSRDHSRRQIYIDVGNRNRST